jgi:hypothetical protein
MVSEAAAELVFESSDRLQVLRRARIDVPDPREARERY